jgi:hypothetical protein
MLSVIYAVIYPFMLSVIMLHVVMLSVVAPNAIDFHLLYRVAYQWCSIIQHLNYTSVLDLLYICVFSSQNKIVSKLKLLKRIKRFCCEKVVNHFVKIAAN